MPIPDVALCNTAEWLERLRVYIVCGRFTLRTPVAQWAQLFLPNLSPTPAELSVGPRYNIAPTQRAMCVLREQTGSPITIQLVRWGLVPAWSDDLSAGFRMINARGETVDSKPSFRRAFSLRRCLIPTDGFYEWKKLATGKQPYLIEQADGGVMAMAGLWEDNAKLGNNEVPLRTFCVITTAANRTMAPLHDRMPVILSSQHFDTWLDPGYRDADALKRLLAPAPDDSLRLTAVSAHVNSPKHDDVECIQPVTSSDS